MFLRCGIDKPTQPGGVGVERDQVVIRPTEQCSIQIRHHRVDLANDRSARVAPLRTAMTIPTYCLQTTPPVEDCMALFEELLNELETLLEELESNQGTATG